MKQKQKHILFHRPTPWHSDIQCSTKTYAQLFADDDNYKVTYLQSNINLGHYFLRKGYFDTWKLGARKEGEIWVTGGLSFVPYLDKTPSLAQLTADWSYKSCLPSLSKLILESGYGEPDIIWTTIPGSSVLKKIFPKAKLFFHVIDTYSAFRGEAVKVLERKDYRRADHVFVIGEALKDYVHSEFSINLNKITNLGQGVHLNKYQNAVPVPSELENLPKPIAVWVGVVKKLDKGLLEELAKQLQRIGGSVVLIGPSADWLNPMMQKYANIIYLGSRPSPAVPAYLIHSDFGIMLYDRAKQGVYKGQHPLKLYEYAAAGLPILSTWHKEFDSLHPPVSIISEERQINTALESAIANRKMLKAQAKQFAAANTWQKCKEQSEGLF